MSSSTPCWAVGAEALCGPEAAFEAIDRLGEAAGDAMFSACFGDAKAFIGEAELDRIFRDATRDPRLRMNSPEVFCLSRAYLLMAKLFDAGYKPRLLKIEESPSTVGTLSWKTKPDELPNRYFDYHGVHWVVAIDTKTAQGGVEPRLLDPQFSDHPMKAEDYLISTTGQKCHKGKPESQWDCVYREVIPRSMFIPELNDWDPRGSASKKMGARSPSGAPRVPSCKWPIADAFAKQIDDWNATGTATGELIPEGLRKGTVLEIKRDLILKAFAEKKTEMEAEVQRTSAFIASWESAPLADEATAKMVLTSFLDPAYKMKKTYGPVKVVPGGFITLIPKSQIDEMAEEVKSAQQALGDYDKVVERVQKNFAGLLQSLKK